MRANKLETALSRDRYIACLAPPDMFFSCTCSTTYHCYYTCTCMYAHMHHMTLVTKLPLPPEKPNVVVVANKFLNPDTHIHVHVCTELSLTCLHVVNALLV